MNDTLPGIGHNNPPEPLFEQATTLVRACDALTKRGPITNDEDAGRLAEYIEQLRDSVADMRAAMDAQIEPHNTAIKVIKERFFSHMEAVNLALTRSKAMAQDWLHVKANRLRAEQEQREREAEQARQDAERAADRSATEGTIESEQAAMAAAERARDAQADVDRRRKRAQAKGDLSSKALTLHTTWYGRVTDYEAAMQEFGHRDDVRAAATKVITSVASRMARELKDKRKAPRGCEFYIKENVQ
jgi:hypothetical protein